MKKTFSVTAIVRSLNKPAQATHVLVQAENEEDAKKKAQNHIQKKDPSASGDIGRVR